MAAAGAMMTAIFSHAAASLALVAGAGAYICGGTGDPDCPFRRQHVCGDHQASSWMVGQTGVRRDKPACCRGCKSPTGKENSDSILASSLAGGSVSCPLKRRPEVPVGRAIELRKADGSGCRLLSEMEEGNTAATSARVAVGPV